MKKPELEFTFDGQTAEADAQALAGFLSTELPDWTARTGSQPPPPKVPGTRNLELTISIITLLVALPSGINHSLDLAERHRLKEKLEHLIDWAKERRARRQRNPFIALPPHGNAVPLDQARPEQLLDVVTAQTTKLPPKP